MSPRSIAVALLGVLLSTTLALGCGPSSGDTNNNTNTNGNSNDNTNSNDNVNTNVPAGCGNQEVEPPEECDNGAANSNSEPDACRLNCTEPRCGDLVRDTGEGCDGGDLGTSTCADFGAAEGALACAGDCSVDSSGCFTCGNGTCEPAETFSSCPSDCGILDVAAGADHSCVVLGDGRVLCWGSNASGQLGDGTGGDSSIPVTVDQLTDAVAIAAGGAHSCAARADGSVVCWGNNDLGQLGDTTIVSSDAPVSVAGLSTAVAVTAGTTHSCAVLSDQTVQCWGANSYGQLGNNNSGSNELSPVGVSSIFGVTKISAGARHTCAVAAGGIGWCWGYNSSGRLGDGTTTNADEPVAVSGAGSLLTISAGQAHSCAVRNANGGVICWGNNADGQLGDGTTSNTSATPVDVISLGAAVDVSAAYDFTCAVLPNGSSYCWGQGDLGQLGNNDWANSPTASQVTGSSGYMRIHGLRDHSCVVAGDTLLRCWGSNALGKLGDGFTDNRNTPTPVVGF